MKKSILAAVGAAALLTASLGTTPASAAKCARIKGTGYGVTDGIARWMASKAVTDSAAKWAGKSKYKLGAIKLTCSGLSCKGAARACKR
ncbi:MAG: hypothetical protein R3D68_09765 [Hyphomicrobiaceae bacterium]